MRAGVPLGMLLAGAFLHAGADIAGVTATSARRVVRAAHVFSVVTALFGALLFMVLMLRSTLKVKA